LPPPKRTLHTERASASSFNFQYSLVFLRSSSSCLRLLPRLPATSILPSGFLSVTCFRRQFLRKWPIQLAFLLFIVCGIFSPLWTLFKNPLISGSLLKIPEEFHLNWQHCPAEHNTELYKPTGLPNRCEANVLSVFVWMSEPGAMGWVHYSTFMTVKAATEQEE
jgi:hypothetical protein